MFHTAAFRAVETKDCRDDDNVSCCAVSVCPSSNSDEFFFLSWLVMGVFPEILHAFFRSLANIGRQ